MGVVSLASSLITKGLAIPASLDPWLFLLGEWVIMIFSMPKHIGFEI